MPSAPSRIARANAASVFSGAVADAPRWPIMRGDLLVMANRQLSVGSIWLCIRNTFQLDIKCSEVDFELGSDGKMTFVFGNPD